MTSPHALVLTLAATLCSFILALVAVVGRRVYPAHTRGGAAMIPSTVAVVAQEVSHADPVPFTVAREPATSRPQARGRCA